MNSDLIFKLKAKTEGEAALVNFDKRLKSIETTSTRMSKSFGTAATYLKGFITFAVIRQAVDYGKGIINIADGLGELSQKTGISANALSGYQEAAKQAGLSQEGLVGALRKFSIAAATARSGSSEVSSAFRSLGISAEELKTKSPEQLMARLSDNFVKLKDGPEKAALAVKLFGKSGTDMIPFLNQGSQALGEFALGFSGDFVARADQFNDTLSQMSSSLKKSFGKGLETLLPTLQNILDTFNKFPSIGVDVKMIFEGIGEAFRLGALAASNFTSLGASAIDTVTTMARQAKAVLSGNFAEGERLERARESREAARYKAASQRQAGLLRNSRLFGDDQIEMIRLREQISTAPGTPKRKTMAPKLSDSSEVNKMDSYIKLKQEENKQLKESLNDYKLTTLELNKLKSARDLDKEAIKASKGMTQEQTSELLKQNESIKEQRKSLIEQQYDQERSFGYGATKAFRDYIESATDAAKSTQKVFGMMFQGIEDAMYDFVRTGKVTFQAFADAILEELTRIAIRQQIIAPIAGALFGSPGGGGGGAGVGSFRGGYTLLANGGVMSENGLAKLNTYAKGGVARSPQLALFGEGSTPEAFVPLPDGRNIPVKMQGGGGVSVSVNVNMGSGETDSKSNSDQGKVLGIAIANAVKSELLKQKRPGGLLAG